MFIHRFANTSYIFGHMVEEHGIMGNFMSDRQTSIVLGVRGYAYFAMITKCS